MNNKMAFHGYDYAYERVKHTRRHASDPCDYNPPIHTNTSSVDCRYDPDGYDAPKHPYVLDRLHHSLPTDIRSPGRCPGRCSRLPGWLPAWPASRACGRSRRTCRRISTLKGTGGPHRRGRRWISVCCCRPMIARLFCVVWTGGSRGWRSRRGRFLARGTAWCRGRGRGLKCRLMRLTTAMMQTMPFCVSSVFWCLQMNVQMVLMLAEV